MKKKFILAGLAITLLLPTITGSQIYASDFKLKVNGLNHVFTEEPKNENGRFMVSVNELSKILNLELEMQDEGKTAVLKNNTTEVVVKDGNTAYTVNGKTRYLIVAVKAEDDALMIPLRNVVENFGVTVVWNSSSQTITLNKKQEVNQKLEQLAELQATGPITEETTVLDYEQALKAAINQNNSLRNLKDSIKYLERNRKESIDNYELTAQIGQDTQAISLQRAIYNLENQMANVNLNENMINSTTEYLLRNSMGKICGYYLDKQLLEESIKLGQENVNNIVLKNSLGMASNNEVTEAKQSLQQSKINLANLLISIKSEQEALNQLLGYNANADIVVTYQPKIRTNQLDIEAYIPGAISQDPSIKLKKDAVATAEYAVATANIKSDIEAATTDEIKTDYDLEVAVRDLYDSQKTMEKAIRTAYNNVKAIEENQKNSEIELQKAKDAYGTAVANYEAGLITEYVVAQSRLAVLNTEIAMQKNTYTFDILNYAIQNPYLLSTMKMV